MRCFLLAVLCACVVPVGAQATFFSETFDSVIEPTFPGSVIAHDTSWKTSDSSSSPGSGGNNAVHTGADPGSLVLGPIDLAAALDGTFSYRARRTSSYSADSLFIRAGTDGVSFGSLLFGGGLPASPSTWEDISVSVPAELLGEGTVYLQFEGRGGSSSGSNMRIDDVLIAGTANPAAMDTAFGFASDNATWDLASTDFTLPVDLEWPGPDSMQGLQFDLSWDAAVVSVDSVALGPSSGVPSSWVLSSSLGVGSGSIALVHLAATGLAPGTFPGFLTVHVSTPASPVNNVPTILTITELLATTNSPDASELSFPDGHRSLTLTLQPSLASASFSALSLDFGSVAAGDSALVQVNVSNPTGSAPLDLAWTPPGPGPLNPVPTLPASIPFGDSATLNLWLRPRIDEGGQQSGAITISHNTTSGATDLSWVALVTGGRGDADGDGAFDVADVVVSLDGTVNPAAIPAEEFARHDLHPFLNGNGELDIRDITVAIQAILRDQWPDGSALPLPPPDPIGKGQSLPLVLVGDSLWVASPVPLRGFQLSFSQAENVIATAKGASSSMWRNPDSGELRLISLAGPGTVFVAGPQLVAVFSSDIRSGASSSPIALNAGIAVDEHGNKITLSLQAAEEIPSEPEPDLSGFGVYPNPLPLGSDLSLALPLVSIKSIELYDPLGRRLWYSRDVVRAVPGDVFRSPGTYFVRIIAGTSGSGFESVLPSGVRTVVVVR